MLLDYIKERYGNLVGAHEQFQYKALQRYMDTLKERNAKAYADKTGFFTYTLWGDALVVWDIYVDPAYRKQSDLPVKQKATWKLFERIMRLAANSGKTVIIGFSEALGQNQGDGIKAMRTVGFQPAFNFIDKGISPTTVFVRGI